jgi:peptidyl-prolyl cis-trans isomerase-like protein 2
MGNKKRHSKDRLFITASEMREDWCGYKGVSLRPLPRLPFNCCALSLQPYENPVCCPEGSIFETLNIIPFIKMFKKNPVSGNPLKVDQLIKLHIDKDSKGNLSCPVSMKVFTDNMKIVAIATTGNVYLGSVVDDLNKKPKLWRDLLTDKPFKGSSDIIILQDPLTCDEKRMVSNFDYIKTEMKFDLRRMKGVDQETSVIEHTG